MMNSVPLLSVFLFEGSGSDLRRSYLWAGVPLCLPFGSSLFADKAKMRRRRVKNVESENSHPIETQSTFNSYPPYQFTSFLSIRTILVCIRTELSLDLDRQSPARFQVWIPLARLTCLILVPVVFRRGTDYLWSRTRRENVGMKAGRQIEIEKSGEWRVRLEASLGDWDED